MNVPYTTPLKGALQSSFVYAGKSKVRYYILSTKCFILILWKSAVIEDCQIVNFCCNLQTRYVNYNEI
jgi:hypothetical protein